MKKILILLLILICCQASGLFSMELTLIEGIGNIAYDKNNTRALSDDSDPLIPAGTFSTLYYPLILAKLSGEFSGLAYNVGFQREPILRNRLFANIQIEEEYFSLEAGPFFGLFNTDKLPVNPGVSAVLRLTYPGIAFIEAAGSSTLAAIPMEKKGNYSQISTDLAAGFWVPYVICSFNLSIKNLTLREEIDLLIEDENIRYYFRADVFAKNFPYNIKVDLGFQNLKRSYLSMGVSGTKIVQNTITDEFKSLFLGLEGTFSISPAFKLVVAAEMPVYSWSARPMMDPPKDTMFFELRLGMIWTLPVGKSQGNS